MISDSDIRVAPDFLKTAVAPLKDPGVGMVTCFYRSLVGAGMAGVFEALSVNSQFLPQTLLAGCLLRMQFAMGAVMLVRRSVFEAIGGFPALSEHLADDFILGQRVINHGKRIAYAAMIVDSVPCITSLSEHIAHMVRWSRTIRVCNPSGYFGLLVLQGLALLTIHLVFFGPTPATAALWIATAASRMVSVGAIHYMLGTRSLWRQIPAIPAADLIHFFTWLSGFRAQTVQWRGEQYNTTSGGRLIPRPRKSSAVAEIPA